MKNVTIISHLTPAEWKKSWESKVVEDTRQNMKEYQSSTCFWGHFKNDSEFTICHHKEFEIKGMSLGSYFNGKVESDPQGCKITGSFGKKLSANLFLGLGAALCILCAVGSYARQDTEVMWTAVILLAIVLLVYFVKPKKGKERILEELKKISFDDDFHRQKITSNPTKKKKKSK